jgi:integrase/recombinase XerD
MSGLALAAAASGVDAAIDAAIVAAVAAMPLPAEEDTGQRWALRSTTAAWLRSRKSDHTRRAYFRDLADYLTRCEQLRLDPRQAVRADIDGYVADLSRRATLSATSTARRLSTLSSWYQYLISNGVTQNNPVVAVDRPSVDPDASPTAGLTGPEATRFMQAARDRSRRDAALLGMLAELGLRVSEALSLDIEDFRTNRGHRTVRPHGKGGRRRELPIPAPLGRDLDAWLEERGAEPGAVFITRTGRRMDQPAVFRLVRSVAEQARLAGASDISPHSLRHTAITAALDAGAPLRDVQDMAGHRDPRMTRRYDRSRGSLDRSPVYLIAGLFAEDEEL